MHANYAQRILSGAVTLILITGSPNILYGYQASGSAPPSSTGTPTDAAPLSANDLQALVAPIALYPDSLVAQILTASTFPDQVAIADYWVQQNKSLTGRSNAGRGQTNVGCEC